MAENRQTVPASANAQSEARPLHPYWIMLIAAVLPGFGHVLLGQTKRGLIMQLFMILLGVITWHLTTPDHSLVGRLAGGLFVYALSVMEAYRLASLRHAATSSLSIISPSDRAARRAPPKGD